MIDFSKYTLQEQQVINDVLYDLQRYLWDNEMEWDYLHNAFFYSTMELRKAIDDHVREAEKKLEAPQARDAAEPAADPPASPDMFGWVGDALDDLCAAGEVIGNDR